MGLSRRALGERVGIGLKQINKYETAVNRVSAGRLYNIAGVLGVPPTFFFDELGDDAAGGWERRPGIEDVRPSGNRREVRSLVDFYHKLSPDIRSRFLRLVRTIADSA
jgi:transcriptional regulator with XRE-family HTH domain